MISTLAKDDCKYYAAHTVHNRGTKMTFKTCFGHQLPATVLKLPQKNTRTKSVKALFFKRRQSLFLQNNFLRLH